jgi:hypothetical protein
MSEKLTSRDYRLLQGVFSTKELSNEMINKTKTRYGPDSDSDLN